MPADPLGPVAPGQSVLETALSAARHNAYSAMCRRVRDQWPREGPKEGRPLVPCVEVLVRNDSDQDLAEFSIVVIQTDTVVDPASLPFDQQGRPCFAVDEPSEDDIEQPLVLSEPIPADGFGRAVMAGHTLAYVKLDDVSAADYEFARPLRGDTSRLRGSPGGPVRILKKTATTGSHILCSVELGLDSADGWLTIGHPMYAATLTGTGTGTVARVMYERVATITRPGYYLCFQPYHGRIVPTPPSSLVNETYAANLRIGWGNIASGLFSIGPMGTGMIQQVCEAATFRAGVYPSGSGRVNPPAAAGGVLIRYLRLDHTNLPYEVGITWGASFTEPFGASTNGLALPDYFTHFIGLGPFAMVRLPGIEGGNTLGFFGPEPVSQPSPSTLGGGSALAVDDSYTVPAGGTLHVPAPGVLANDTVPAGYKPVQDSSPQYGTLAFNSDGSFTYVQNGDLGGKQPPLLDQFAYHLASGTAASQPANVNITITGGTTSHGGFSAFVPGVGGMGGATPSTGTSTSPGPDSGGGST